MSDNPDLTKAQAAVIEEAVANILENVRRLLRAEGMSDEELRANLRKLSKESLEEMWQDFIQKN